jgi:hypothetical protein
MTSWKITSLTLLSTLIMFSTLPTEETPVWASVRLQSRTDGSSNKRLVRALSVRLQGTDKGEQRAVKAIHKTLAVKYGVDHKRQLAALAVFSRAKVE